MEQAVIRQLRKILKHPDIAARIIRKIDTFDSNYRTNEIIAALQDTERLWDMLFPDQQKRVIQLLLRKITASECGFKLHFLPNGIETIVGQINERDD